MANATSAVSPLRRRMIDDMTLRNLSPATQRSYTLSPAEAEFDVLTAGFGTIHLCL